MDEMKKDDEILNNENDSITPNVEEKNAESKIIDKSSLVFHSIIKNVEKHILYKDLKLKASRLKKKFKLHPKEIFVNEMFTTCETLEECKRQQKLAEEVTKEAEQVATKQKSKKSKLLSLLFLLINIVAIVVTVIISASNEEGMVSITDMIEVANLWYFLGALLAFAMLMGFETLRYYILIWKSTRHSRPFLSYKVAATGKYFDNITPLSTGGQPMQIYYLSKRGIKASTASTMPFAVYIFNQLLAVVVSTLVIIFSKKIAGGLDPAIFTAAVIGIVLNFLIMIFVFTLSFSKKVGPVVTIWILKLLHKMRIVKDYTALFRKVMRFVNEYQKTFRYFVANAWNFILMSASTLGVIATRYLIPAFVVLMFTPQIDMNFFEIYASVFIWCVLIESVLCYIPWPGAGGIAEVTYVTMFAYFSLSAGTTVWAMLIYRLFQYYAYLIQGLFLLLYDYFIGNKKIGKVNEYFAKLDSERMMKMKKRY